MDAPDTSYSKAYQRIQRLIAEDTCVILDGGNATELERMSITGYRVDDKGLWGTWALYHAPHAALEVHRRYIDAGCDVISTATWAISKATEVQNPRLMGTSIVSHWMDTARLGLNLARQAVEEAGQNGKCAVGFSVHGDVDSPEGLDRFKLLARVFEENPPDLILLETMSLIRKNLTLPAVELMVRTGIPVWLSFRRCIHGVCGVYGQHWGGPEGDVFGRTARTFEEMGVKALLLNCLPVDHVPGMLPWLRDFTDMPLGVYPNLGHYLDPGWKFDESIGPEAYGQLALQWREEGAQIVGGCCGVTPEHIAAASGHLRSTKPGERRPRRASDSDVLLKETPTRGADIKSYQPWTDRQKRVLYPLPFPKIVVDKGVFRPTQGSFLIWKYLFNEGIGGAKRCLDVGCGSGILTVQLALNGAEHVTAIDIQDEAVANTMTNAFRNGVSQNVNAEVVDLYTYLPDEKYDLVVASLYQMPVDPMREITGHRPVDFWGRNMLDHLISLLPDLLVEGGEAYIMQISILGQQRTLELIHKAGMISRVIDYSFFHFSPDFMENFEQINRVEELSDAYHLNFGDDDVMVMYLLKVERP